MAEVSFKTNARHIGQLGRELVTDFVTALVELIKNAYDADAECAKIIIEDTKSINGKIIIADCGTGMTIDEFDNKWMVIGTSNKLSEPYTAKGRKKAGKKGIGRFSVERLAERVTIYSFPENNTPFWVHIDWNRFEELDILSIKQRIDILAQRKDREAAKYISSQIQYAIMLPMITIEDSQCIRESLGNSYYDYSIYFDKDVLSVLEERVLPILQKYESNRQLIDEIKTPLNILENTTDCEEYYILQELCQKVGQKNYNGTIMILEGLRDEWTQKDVDKLQKELRLLVAPDFLEDDPFSIEFQAPDFKVEEMVSVNDILNASFAKIHACICEGGRKSTIIYEDQNGVKVPRSKEYEVPLLCGDITFELYYFLRDSQNMKRSGYNSRFATRVLDTYCGIKIYRDKFRVKPYGESGNDWLYLDKEKVSDTHGYLVGNNQTIGRINISDVHNPLLVDATNREGIIENVAFEQLRKFIKECIAIISEVRKKEYEEKEREKKQLEIESKKIQAEKEQLMKRDKEVSELIERMSDVKLDELHTSEETKKKVNVLLEKVQELQQKHHEYQQQYEENAEKRYKIVQDVLEYKESELNMYKNLASLGMLAGEFGHETSDVVNRIQNSVQVVVRAIRSEPKHASLLKILDIIKDDFRRISSYSEMIIGFLRKRKREMCESLVVPDVINEICKYYKDILEEFNIAFQYTCENGITVSMRQVDLESIIINLITNAYAQLKVSSVRKISIRVWKELDVLKIRVDDSGPGVPENEREEIFVAFKTSKEDGIGLGLNIVRDIVTFYGGTIICKESELYGGACFEINLAMGDDNSATEGNLY